MNLAWPGRWFELDIASLFTVTSFRDKLISSYDPSRASMDVQYVLSHVCEQISSGFRHGAYPASGSQEEPRLN